jgi:hypothetical protein
MHVEQRDRTSMIIDPLAERVRHTRKSTDIDAHRQIRRAARIAQPDQRRQPEFRLCTDGDERPDVTDRAWPTSASNRRIVPIATRCGCEGSFVALADSRTTRQAFSTVSSLRVPLCLRMPNGRTVKDYPSGAPGFEPIHYRISV